ncbi:MAG: L,D-transpeptidase [Bacteroidota bacterium]
MVLGLFWLGLSTAAAGGTTLPPDTVTRPVHAFMHFLPEYLEVRYPEKQFGQFVYIAIRQQRLFLIDSNRVVDEYPISTSRFGVGNRIYSKQTPEGLHTIRQKVGRHIPEGGIIYRGSYTGRSCLSDSGTVVRMGNLITSRILRLHGEEQGVNRGGRQDTFSRFIYIHGTANEALIGTPASNGCIRMCNADVVELFNRIPEGTYVVILNN